MVSGSSVVKILLDAKVLDRLYLTQIHRNISADDPSAVTKIGSSAESVGKKLGNKEYKEGIIDEVLVGDHEGQAPMI